MNLIVSNQKQTKEISEMKQALESCLTNALGLVNVFPTKITDREDVDSLLRKLHPMSTDKTLIRFGPKGDGGYLLPDDLAGVQACFSPGVSFVSGFEKDCADLGIKVFLADKSVECPAEEHELFHFTNKFVGVTSNMDFITLDKWVASSISDPKSDLLLQIDIEGYEYEVFLSASDTLMHRFRIIVAEFHSLDQLWNRPFFDLASRAFDKILQTHTCVHLHPNNCCGLLRKNGIDIPRVMEFTFIKNDRINHSSYQTDFPHSLDCNNTAKPPLVLPTNWYRDA